MAAWKRTAADAVGASPSAFVAGRDGSFQASVVLCVRYLLEELTEARILKIDAEGSTCMAKQEAVSRNLAACPAFWPAMSPHHARNRK